MCDRLGRHGEHEAHFLRSGAEQSFAVLGELKLENIYSRLG